MSLNPTRWLKLPMKSFINVGQQRHADPAVPTHENAQEKFADLASALRYMHGKDASDRYWRAVLCWYLIDFVKVMQSGAVPSTWEYSFQDNIDFKKRGMASYATAKGERRFTAHSLFEIARNDSLGFGHRSVIRGVVLVVFLVREIASYLIWRSSRGRARRELRRRCMAIGLAHSDALTRSMIVALPVHLVEDFNFYSRRHASYDLPLDSRKLKNGYAIRYAEREHYDLPTMLLQHGAGYGELPGILEGGATEFMASHYFMTWGHRVSANSIPWRAPRLERFERNYLHEKVEASLSKSFLVLLQKNHRKDFEVALSIHEALAKTKDCSVAESDLRIRPRSGASSWSSSLSSPFCPEGQLQKLFAHDPRIESNKKVPIYRAIRQSKLVILTGHPATAFLECARVWHPCVALVRSADSYLPAIRPYYEYFTAVGVFHLNVDGMIGRIMQDDEALIDWWVGVTDSAEYRSFRRLFCGLVS